MLVLYTVCVVLSCTAYSSALSIPDTRQERFLEQLKEQDENIRSVRNLANHLNDLRQKRAFDMAKDKAKRLADMVNDEVQKRFASLNANDCGSFECAKERREAVEKLRNVLNMLKRETSVRDKTGAVLRKLGRRRSLDRTKDYIGTGTGVFGSDYGGSNYGGGGGGYSNYGSKGWDDEVEYYDGHWDDYSGDDYYDDDYDNYDEEGDGDRSDENLTVEK